MTVKELIEKLKDYPENYTISVAFYSNEVEQFVFTDNINSVEVEDENKKVYLGD